jgi:hypothetical protein
LVDSDKIEELIPLKTLIETWKIKIDAMRGTARENAQVALAEVTNVTNENDQYARQQACSRANAAFNKVKNCRADARKEWKNMVAKMGDAASVKDDDNMNFAPFKLNNRALEKDAEAMESLELGLRAKQEMKVWLDITQKARDTVQNVCDENEDAKTNRALTVALKMHSEVAYAKSKAQKARDRALKMRAAAVDDDVVMFMFMARKKAWRARAEANRAENAVGRLDRSIVAVQLTAKNIDGLVKDALVAADEAEQVAGLKK